MQKQHGPTEIDVQDVLRLTREEAAGGTMKEVAVITTILCTQCNSAKAGFCATCSGWGTVRTGGFFRLKKACCPSCAGDGLAHDTKCPLCAGTGRIKAKLTHQVRVPAGVETGMQLRLHGQGHRWHPRQAPGDLYLRIEVE